jgi:hypothetical protein
MGLKMGILRPGDEPLEHEELILYPHIEDRLRKRAIPFFTAYKPAHIPQSQI